jgi:hypothetical protein
VKSAVNNRHNVAIGKCAECAATYYDGIHPELRCRWQHCEHLSGCEYGSVSKRTLAPAVSRYDPDTETAESVGLHE